MAETWTDEELARKEHREQEWAADCAARSRTPNTAALKAAELYRLARLGLALELLGRVDLNEIIDWDSAAEWDTLLGKQSKAALDALLKHPAWTR